jgi:competence protein ComEC
VRAGIAGALGSLAWLTARARDRWYFLLLGALALLAWNPYVAFDPGFQLSFAAVVAIFVVAPRLRSGLEGYPLPAGARMPIAISAACGIVTAPILWLQFKAVPLLAVPANVLAAPAIGPLLGLAFVTAAFDTVSPPTAHALAWVNGLDAWYIGQCARVIAATPFAQVRSGAGLLALGAAGAAAYAWCRWPS